MLGKREFEENKFLLDSISDVKIKTRIETNLIWFINKANKCKMFFYIFTIITIIAPIVSTILISMPMDEGKIKFLSCCMSGITTVCTSIIGVLNIKKSWEIYRIQAEIIKKNLSRKLYNNLTDQQILEEIELSMELTDKSWSTLWNKAD